MRVIKTVDIPLVFESHQRLKSFVSWNSLQKHHLIYEKTEKPKDYSSFGCIYEDCLFFCSARWLPHPLFGYQFMTLYIENFRPHTCNPLEDKPTDFSTDSIQPEYDSPYVKCNRAFERLMPYKLMDNISYILSSLPPERTINSKESKDIADSFNENMKIHPKYKGTVEDTRFMRRRIRTVGFKPLEMIKNIHVVALVMKTFSPSSTISIDYIKKDDDEILTIPKSTVVLTEEYHNIVEVNDNSNEEEEPVDIIDNSNEDEEHGDIEEPDDEMSDAELDSEEAALSSRKRNRGYESDDDFLEHEESKSQEMSDAPRGISFLKDKNKRNSKDKEDQTQQQPIAMTPHTQAQIARIRSIYREKKKKEQLRIKVTRFLNGNPVQLVSLHELNSIHSAYYTHVVEEEERSKSSSVSSATATASPTAAASSTDAASPTAAASSTTTAPYTASPAPSSTSQINSTQTKFSLGFEDEEDSSCFYEQNQSAQTYMETLSKDRDFDTSLSFCQRNGCSLDPNEVHCGDLAHVLFSGSEKIDKELNFPLSSLLHNINKWYSEDIDLNKMSIGSFFVCSSSMKEIVKGADPIITVDATFLKRGTYGKFLVFLAVVQTPTYTAHPIGFGFYPAENSAGYISFLTKLNEALDGFITPKISFITDADKGLHRAIKTVFPDSHHIPCLHHLVKNARKLRLVPQADRKRFISLLYLLEMCPDKSKAERYHQELVKMIDHDEYGGMPLSNSKPNMSKITYNMLIDIEKISWAHSPIPRCNQVTSNSVEITNKRILRLRRWDPWSLTIGLYNLSLSIAEGEWHKFYRKSFAGKFINDDVWLIPGLIDNLGNALLHSDSYTYSKIDPQCDKRKAKYYADLLDDSFLGNMIRTDRQPSQADFLYGSCQRFKFDVDSHKATKLRVGRLNACFSKKRYLVDFQNQTCTCSFWQNNQYPCLHALEIAIREGIPVSSLCHERYYMKTQLKFLYNAINNYTQLDTSITSLKLVSDATKGLAIEESFGLGSDEINGRGRPKNNPRYDVRMLSTLKNNPDFNPTSREEPAPKRRKLTACGICKTSGHTSRKCPSEQRKSLGKTTITCSLCRLANHNCNTCLTHCKKCKQEGHTHKNCTASESDLAKISKPKPINRCSLCKEKGHTAPLCSTWCYICKKKGHIKVDCPKFGQN